MPRFLTPDNVPIHYTDEGTGADSTVPAVLAIPGLTRNGGDFDHVAPHLPVRLIRVDLRGRGKSGWADPETYTIAQEAQDVLGLLDHLGLDKVAILGTSRGGLIAMTLAAVAKDRLAGVALVDIGPVIEPDGLAVIGGYVGKRPSQKTYEQAARFRALSWGAFQDVPMDRWMHEVGNHYDEGPDGLNLRYDPALAKPFATAAQPLPDMWPLFDALSGLPLALIRGANSDLLSMETAREMQRRRPDMHFANVPGRGHVPFLDEPQSLNALKDWIAEL